MNDAMYQIIGRPIVTEKTTGQRDDENKIAFRVHTSANKIQIRQAIEKLFNVRVKKVRTLQMPGKPKRFGRLMGHRAGWKKAIVTLAEGDSIEFYGGEDEDEI
jgi:large subunit ribosomal protein L23